MLYTDTITNIYDSFNARDIEAVLAYFHPSVDWPNGWEGGYVHGHDAVRSYWTRQWAALDPHVEPSSSELLPDGRLKVEVKQTIKDSSGKLLFTGTVYHVYTFDHALIRKMEIEEVQTAIQ